MSGRATNLVKNISKDRILVLKPIEGTDVLSTKGMVDKRLFSRENNIHAIQDPEYGFWSVKYDSGVVPPSFQQRWTSFTKLYNFVEEHYKRRNVEIKEIIDT
jgi:hypothetical protein